jgi:ketosteroid isomerase-like protein
VAVVIWADYEAKASPRPEGFRNARCRCTNKALTPSAFAALTDFPANEKLWTTASRWYRVGVVLIAIAFALAFVQPRAPGAQTDTEIATLTRLETDWNAAHVHGDAAALERLFADDLVVMVPGMRVMTKADAVGMFTSGRMKFDRYETSETKFRVYDATAIVTGRLRRTRVIGGNTVDDDWRFTKVYLRRAGRWQVVSFHASNTGA